MVYIQVGKHDNLVKTSESKTNIYLLAHFGHILVGSFVNLGSSLSGFDSFSDSFLKSINVIRF